MKRAPRGTGSIREYAPGRYRATITTGYQLNPVTKKKKRLTKTFTGKSRKEVLNKLTEFKYKTRNLKPESYTFRQYSERWLSLKEDAIKESTYKSYEYIIKRFNEYTGNTLLMDITPRVLNDYLTTLSKASRTTHKTILSGVFKEAVKEHLIESNPMQDTIRTPKASSTVSPLTKKEIKNLLDNSEGIYHLLFLTALETGMRKGELQGLMLEDIHDTYISVKRTRTLTGALTEPKTKSSIRDITVNKELVSMLRSVGRRFIFPMSSATISTHFNALCPHHRFHDLRHTHATFLISAGVDVKTVSRRLGHSSVSMTLNIYTHVLPAMDKKASDTIHSMLLSCY